MSRGGGRGGFRGGGGGGGRPEAPMGMMTYQEIQGTVRKEAAALYPVSCHRQTHRTGAGSSMVGHPRVEIPSPYNPRPHERGSSNLRVYATLVGYHAQQPISTD
jgi:hypothetical protein